MKRTAFIWLIAGVISYCLLPWYATEGGIFSFGWVLSIFSGDGSGSALASLGSKPWLLGPALGFVIALASIFLTIPQRQKAGLLIIAGVVGLFLLVAQGLDIVATGSRFGLWPNPEAMQIGMGLGALGTAVSLLMLVTTGVSGRSAGQGDAFITGLIGAIIGLVTIFVFFPVLHILIGAFSLPEGGWSLWVFFPRFLSGEIWGVSCLIGGGNCGVAINSLMLAVMAGAGTTMLGLAFALVLTRTGFRAKKLLRVMTIIPIITPPFVIGLALILLLGRTGTITVFIAEMFGLEESRWLYGFWGIYVAQLLSFTPIAFLVLIGVVEGVSPSMEEASQTLNASRWQTFRSVTWPLMRPGLANAFLLGFIESLADFGNPLVLGGNFDLLSTEIFFAIVGSVADGSRAAVLSIALLCLTLTAFLIQRRWVGKGSYATVTGKADSGRHAALATPLKYIVLSVSLIWAGFTAVVYSMIVFGSFVKLWGYDNSFTLDHYIRAFKITVRNGIHLTGTAWDSYITTLNIAAIAAPLTAIVGLATAYLLVRQRFAGKAVFEFSTMLSFAIPGTVIGVAYVMAFNFPPIELTGTGLILIIVFVFRNMPVGVRGGIAAMSQLDKSLDEASITLGANSATTIRRIILPLLGPAILATLTYSFVRTITSVSAVIFLVSARYNMATSFIVGRVENGEFGLAIAYSAVLIVTMLVAILLLQAIIGTRRLRRSNRVEA